MQAAEEIAKINVELFVEKYPMPRPGWTVSSKNGHLTVRVRELPTTAPHGRRFDVMVSDHRGTVSAHYERVEKGRIRALSLPRLEQLILRFNRARRYDIETRNRPAR
jgi:hypothetical protein